MRRSLGVATVVALVGAIAMTALATVPSGNYLDEFNSEAYSGSNGSEEWKNDPWKELGDDANPNTGSVYVDSSGCSGRCLKISSQGKQLNGVGANRHADTSPFSRIELSYEVGFEGNDESTDATLNVEKSIDGGKSWFMLASHRLYAEFSARPVLSIGGPYDSTIIRFTVSGVLTGEVYLDDVEVKGEYAGETTSTSTTSAPTTSTSSSVPPTTMRETTTTIEVENSTTTTSTTVLRGDPSTTTTTISDTTSTTEAVFFAAGDSPPTGPPGPPEGSGIREAATGIQANFDDGLFGDVEGGDLSISGVDHQVDYRMAVELIKSSWVWLVVLALVVAWSIVSGLDRRRSVAGA
jgi:hypothetical protein